MKTCVLYERDCIDCGECNLCDLVKGKRCDNCEKCLHLHDHEYKGILIDEILVEKSYNKD